MSEFQEKVNSLVGQMEQDDSGTWNLPEEVAKDLDEPTMYAVTTERRRRDTQSAYTKAQQESKKQKAFNEELQTRILSSNIDLTKEQKYELNDLKKSDPDKWRAKLNEYEEEARTSLKNELAEIEKNTSNKSELEVRQEQMAAWSESTGIELNDTIVQNELPPRYLKDLEDGKITFQDFLDKAGKFLTTDKVIENSGDDDDDDDSTDLSSVAGGREPSKNAQEGDFDESYEKTLF